jgi:hypothetical protein
MKEKVEAVEKKELKIHYVKVDDLIESEYNPRKINPKQKKELIDSITKFGLREPLKVNSFPGRENVLISGHQRFNVAKSLGFETVPVTYEYVNLQDEKEMNLRWNKNGGEFDMELVNDLVDRELLLTIGFANKELPTLYTDFEQEFNDIDESNPVYPITPKFNEKYDFVMIFASSEMDFTWLKNVLEIEREKDYNSNYVGEGRVITIKKFQELYTKWNSK